MTKDRSLFKNLSKEEYEIIANYNIDIECLFDAEGKLKWVNQAIEKILGYSVAECMSMRDFPLPFIHPDYKEEIVRKFESVLDSDKQINNFQHKVFCKDGTKKWLSASFHTCKDSNGNFFGVRSSSRDITVLKNEELKRLKSEQMLKSLVESSSDHIFSLSPEGVYLTSNNHLIDKVVSDRDFLIGKSVFDIHDRKVSGKYKNNIDKVLETEESVTFEHDIETSNGIKYHLDTLFPIFIDGDLRQIGGICHDITELKETYIELETKELFIKSVTNTTPAIIYVYDLIKDQNIYCNDRIKDLLGFSPEEIRSMGKRFLGDNIHPDDKHLLRLHILNLQKSEEGQVLELECRIKTKIGEWKWLNSREVVFSRTSDGLVEQTLGIAVDVSKYKENAKNLEINSKKLDEKNIALRTLIEHRDEEILNLKNNLESSVNILVKPYLDKLKKTEINTDQSTYLELIEENCKEILGSFNARLNDQMSKLSPAEFQVANLVKVGRSTKEIANILKISVSTVSTHRKNIRNKIGIKNRKKNLSVILRNINS